MKAQSSIIDEAIPNPQAIDAQETQPQASPESESLAQSLESHEASLPAGWELGHDHTTNRVYYINKEAKLSQWHHPRHPSMMMEEAPPDMKSDAYVATEPAIEEDQQSATQSAHITVALQDNIQAVSDTQEPKKSMCCGHHWTERQKKIVTVAAWILLITLIGLWVWM